MGGAAWSTRITCKGPDKAPTGWVRTGLTPGHESLAGREESSVLGAVWGPGEVGEVALTRPEWWGSQWPRQAVAVGGGGVDSQPLRGEPGGRS